MYVNMDWIRKSTGNDNTIVQAMKHTIAIIHVWFCSPLPFDLP